MLVLPIRPAVHFDLALALGRWLDGDHHISFNNTKIVNPLAFVLPKPDFRSSACRKELVRLQSLRNTICEELGKNESHAAAWNEGMVETLHQYHAVLLEFEKKGFPTIDDELTGIKLVWKGAWAPQQETHSSLVWDRANVLFNLAALLSHRVATSTVFTDRESCKQAVAHSKQAASFISLLLELVSPQDFTSIDFSPTMLHFWHSYLLAQAQDFVFRMASLGDDPNHGTLASLAQSSYELYSKALKAAQDSRLLSEVPKMARDEWGPYCKCLSMIVAAKAEYHQSVVYRISANWGHEIFHLRIANSKLDACLAACKAVDQQGETKVSYTKRECETIAPVVKERQGEAEKDNRNIYGEQIPETTDKIESKQLAKSTLDLPSTMIEPREKMFQS